MLMLHLVLEESRAAHYIRLIVFAMMAGTISLTFSNCVASEIKSRITPQDRILPVPSKYLHSFYTSLGHYEGSSLLGCFFPQVMRGHTWTWWWDTGTILDGVGTGIRKLFPPPQSIFSRLVFRRLFLL